MAELRRFLRAERDYRVDYGAFPESGRDTGLKTSYLKNIGAGGLLFISEEPFEDGRQLFLKIHITGWRVDGDDIVEDPTGDVPAVISAIAEVTRCEPILSQTSWTVGVKFLGRVLT